MINIALLLLFSSLSILPIHAMDEDYDESSAQEYYKNKNDRSAHYEQKLLHKARNYQRALQIKRENNAEYSLSNHIEEDHTNASIAHQEIETPHNTRFKKRTSQQTLLKKYPYESPKSQRITNPAYCNGQELTAKTPDWSSLIGIQIDNNNNNNRRSQKTCVELMECADLLSVCAHVKAVAFCGLPSIDLILGGLRCAEKVLAERNNVPVGLGKTLVNQHKMAATYALQCVETLLLRGRNNLPHAHKRNGTHKLLFSL